MTLVMTIEWAAIEAETVDRALRYRQPDDAQRASQAAVDMWNTRADGYRAHP